MEASRGLLVSAFAALVAVTGCTRQESTQAPAAAPLTASGAPDEQPGVSAPSDVSPIEAQSWADAFILGRELKADGTAVDHAGDDFERSEPIHLSMAIQDAPAGASVRVIWFGPEERVLAQQEKAVTAGKRSLTFTVEDTAAWSAGDYRAEVWVGDEKVNQQLFRIVGPAG